MTSAREAAPTTTSLAKDRRHDQLLQTLQSEGSVDVSGLAARFEVAAETIRRDLKFLEHSGRLERVHGGAVRMQPVIPRSPKVEADIDLGPRLWEHLPKTGSMIIGPASCGVQLAEAILSDPPDQNALTVVTSSLEVAVAMSRVEQVRVYNLGGTARPGSLAQEGTWPIEELRRFRCDLAVLGPAGVDVGGGLTVDDPAAAAVAEAQCAASRRVIAVAGGAAVGTVALVRFAPLAALSELLLTSRPDPTLAAPIEATGVSVRCLAS